MKNNSTYLCKCHPDFHLPADVAVGDDFNGVDYARKAKQAGVDSLVAFAKCHYGFAYYKTDVGTVHPGLVKDMLEEFSKGCREAGIGITFYYSVFLDAAAGRKHSDWAFRPKGKPLDELLQGKYISICVNSGYLEELLIPQVMELLERYDVDEMFFDTMSDFHPCFCDNCRRLFGRPLPEDSNSPYWLEYVNWYYNNYENFFNRILEAISRKRPEVSTVINWKWSATLPETPSRYVQRLAGDLFTSGAVASYFSHYWAGTGYPFDYMCGRFLHGLGDWSSNAPDTLKYTAASTIANGGSFYLIDRQLPNGQMEDRAYAIMKDVFDFVKERRDMVEDTNHVPETAVLHSLEHLVGPNFEYFPDYKGRTERMRQFKGVAKFFINHAMHYTAINMDMLKCCLQNYKLLILPETDYIDQDAKAAIMAFVEKGGKLLMIQNCHLYNMDKDLMGFAGVNYLKHSEAHYSYIAQDNNGIPDPILVRGHAALVEPLNGTKVIARFAEPLIIGSDGKEFGHGFAPPTNKEGFAAATLRNVGQGAVIYVAAPLLTSYETFVNPSIASFLKKLYKMLLPAPLVEVDSRAQVEMTAMRKGNDLIVHLVNHSGKEAYAGENTRHLPITEFIPELFNLTILVRSPQKSCEISSVPAGIIQKMRDENGYILLRASNLKIMSSVRLYGYFEN